MNIKTTLQMIGGYSFRWIGYPIEPQLIELGKPNRDSPVLVTCNFVLTVKRVIKALKGIDCFLLIAPSKGINVWCGACGGDFNTYSISSIIETSQIQEKVNHRTIILPQLSAPGIDIVQLKKDFGWDIKFGPVEAEDIPAYIEKKCVKTEKMRTVQFPLKQRFDMGNVYFFSLFTIFSLIYGIAANFLSILDFWLFLDSVLFLITGIYGALLIVPTLPIRSPQLKVGLFGLGLILVISVGHLLLFPQLFYWIWNCCILLLSTLILIEDFNGLTPTNKSEIGEKTWKKGEDKMDFGIISFPIQPYGEITLTKEKCIGCQLCIEVCPRNIFSYVELEKTVILSHKDACINCNACVNRCPTNCLRLAEDQGLNHLKEK